MKETKMDDFGAKIQPQKNCFETDSASYLRPIYYFCKKKNNKINAKSKQNNEQP